MPITGICGVQKDRAMYLLKSFRNEELELQIRTVKELRILADLIESGEAAVVGLEMSKGALRGQHAGKRSLNIRYYDNEVA